MQLFGCVERMQGLHPQVVTISASAPQKQTSVNSTHRNKPTSRQGRTSRSTQGIQLHTTPLRCHFQILTAPSRLPESNIFVGSSVTLTSNTASSWLVRGATRPFSCSDGWRWQRSNRRHDRVFLVYMTMGVGVLMRHRVG